MRGSGAERHPGRRADPAETLVGQYEELREELVAIARQVTRRRDLAEDVVQDVFVSLLARIRAGRPPELSAGYITTAVRRAALHWHRNRGKRQDPNWCSAVARNSSIWVPNPLDVLRETLMQELIAETQEKLTPGQQTVFELVDLQGLSYAAAAEKTQTSEDNVKNQLSRARQAFRELLASRGLRSLDHI